jgi:hypothetical protein
MLDFWMEEAKTNPKVVWMFQDEIKCQRPSLVTDKLG